MPDQLLTESQKMQATRLEKLAILRARAKHLETKVYGDYLAAIVKDTAYYEGTFGEDLLPVEWKRKGIRAVVPPTAYNAVENANDHILVTPNISVPVRPTDSNLVEEQAVAERKRLALRFWWDQVAINGNPISAAAKNMMKDGKLVLKKTIRWDLVPDEVDELPIGLDEFPWELESLSPSSVFEDPDRPYDPSYVYEVQWTTVDSAVEKYPDGLANWRQAPGETLVKVMEYYSKPQGTSQGMHVIWIDDEPVVDTINPYSWRRMDGETFTGYVPYIIRAAGWGERKHEYEPEKYYVGIIRRMHSLLDAQAGHLTDGSVQMKYSTFPAILTSIPESIAINVGPGEVTRKANPEDTIEFIKPPELPASLFRLIQEVAAEANGLTKFDALGGTGLQGVDTATESDNIVRNASAKLNSPVLALRSALTQVTRQILQDVENVLEQPVLLFGAPDDGQSLVTLKPEEINGFYHVTIELSTTDKAALDRAQARLWADLYRMFPGMSEKLAMTNAGIQDPQKVQEDRAEEDTFRGPRMTQVRELGALVAMGDAAKLVLEAAQRTLQGEAQQADQASVSDGSDPLRAEQPQAAPQPGAPAIAGAQQEALTQRSDLASL